MKDQLEEECGVTEVSLNNAKILLARGEPTTLHFTADIHNCDYFVHAEWPDFKFTFTGFAWGYGGTAPEGLLKFLDLAHVSGLTPNDLHIDKYGKTSVTWTRFP